MDAEQRRTIVRLRRLLLAEFGRPYMKIVMWIRRVLS